MVFHALTFARSRGRCWKPRPKAAVFYTSQGTWRMLMHWKTMFNHYYCIKKENICYIFALFLALFCFAFSPMSGELYFHALCLFWGRAANLWPRYDHVESAQPCINSAWIALLIHRFSPVNARLLIMCDTAFLCNNCGYKPVHRWSPAYVVSKQTCIDQIEKQP